MISENQELIKANERVASLEQRIEFRKHGGSGKYITELIQAKKNRDQILFTITNNSTETKELIGQALKLVDSSKIRKEEIKEIEKTLDKLTLYMDLMENGIPKWNKEHTPEPNYEQIGVKWRKDRNLHEKLETAQKLFDSTKLKSESSSPVGKSGRTAQLQKARNALNLAIKSVEKEDDNITFYTLRAEVEWKETIIKEKEAEIEFYQVELAKAEKILDGF